MAEEELTTLAEETVENTPIREGFTLYELGFHLLPTIVEEEVAGRFGDLKALVEEQGGTVVSEGFPSLMPLAYTIAVKAGKFDRAYFGWMKFELEPSHIAAIKDATDVNPDILRFIIIKTVPDAAVPKKPFIARFGEAAPAADAEELPKAVVSEEELDKTLEGILA